MRLFKFIISISVITLVALIYVHQQIELVKMSYAIDYKERNLEHILDHKEYLGYNIKELESPSRLEKVLLSQKVDIAFPRKGHIVKVISHSSNIKSGVPLRTIGVERKTKIFGILEFFGLSREAHAKEK